MELASGAERDLTRRFSNRMHRMLMTSGRFRQPSEREAPGSQMVTLTTARNQLYTFAGSFLKDLDFQPTGPAGTFVRTRGDGLVDRILIPVDVRGTDGGFCCTVNVSVGCDWDWDDPEAEHASRQQLSVSTNLGILMPERRWHFWEFVSTDIQAAALHEIAQSIRHYAMPWLDRFSSCDDVLFASRDRSLYDRRARVWTEESLA